VREAIRKDFREDVGGRIAVVVDVRFDHDTVDATDDVLVVLMKGELNIGLAKLNLLPACSSARMKEAGGILDRELSCCCADLYLIDEASIAPGEEAILCGCVGCVPAKLLDVFEWCALRQSYLAHRLAEVEEAGERSLGLVEEAVVSLLASGIVYVRGNEWIGGLRGWPAGVHEAKAGVVGDKHDVERLEIGVGELYGYEASLFVPVGGDEDGVVVAEVVEEGKIVEGDVVGFVFFPDLDLLVAVYDADEELGGCGKWLACAVEDAKS